MRTISPRNILFTIVVFLSIFQRVIVEYVPAFSYYDELLTLGMVALYIVAIFKQKKIKKRDFKIFALIFITIICGIIGNLISGYSRSTSLILNGILVWFKSFIIYVCANKYFEQVSVSTNGIIASLAKGTRIFICAAFLGLVLSTITHWGIEPLAARMRYGLHPYEFIYSQPALLSWYCIAFAMILSLDNAMGNEQKNFKYLVLLSIVWAFTLRSRAFVFILCYWFLYVVLFKVNGQKMPKIRMRYVLAIGCIALVAAKPAVEKYFLSGTTTRAILLLTGIDIAKRFFPFGAGFANYATSASYKVYSPLYYYYGFNHIYRLNEVTDGMTELTDCYWPAVMGELGALGLILIVYILVTVGKSLVQNSTHNRWMFLTVLFLIITSLFSSVATNIYSSDSMVVYTMIVCIGIHLKTEHMEGASLVKASEKSSR